MAHEIEVFADAEALAQAAALALIDSAQQACAARGRFVLCLAGGRTPQRVYELLASPALAQHIDWQRVEIVFGDERCVPADDPASNFGMAWRALLRHVPVPDSQLHRMQGELAAPDAAARYETELKAVLGVLPAGAPASPFDLVTLGMGPDGHTASLFPGSHDAPLVWVAARVRTPQEPMRLTLTPLVLNASHKTLFWIAGADKAARVAEVIEGPRKLEALPAQRIQPEGRLGYMLDQAAAAQLTSQR